ncbi:hypothetical protein EGM30_03095 [Salmonella enterica subsp. enterica]|nr:hypothetical protein [Salmonella enterica subsp. enterica serovar Lisboa]
MRHPTQKSGFTAAFFMHGKSDVSNDAKDNETAKFIFSAAVRFSNLMPSVVPLSVIFDQLIVS